MASPPPRSPGSTLLLALLALCLIVQVLVALVLTFVPFGFDHPSEWGLDFGHFLLFAAAYALAWILGCILAAVGRQWRLLLAQVSLPLIAIILFVVGSRIRYSP